MVSLSFDFILNILISFFILSISLYYFSTKTFNYWKDRGVKHACPTPFFGNSMETILRKKTLVENQQSIYDLFSNESYVGMFLFRIPILMIKNPKLVHTILTKDFTSFFDRGITPDEKLDLLSSHLVNLKGQKWKKLRNKITPAFSSGKLRSMCLQLDECTCTLLKHFEKTLKNNTPQNVLEAVAKYATDVIGSCAFGLNIRSLEDPDSLFRKMGQDIFKPSLRIVLKFIARAVHPRLPYYLNLKFLRKDVEEFFLNFVKDRIDQENSEYQMESRNFINILLELRKSELNHELFDEKDSNDQNILDDQTLASNVFAFFLGGFETVSTTMSFFLLEMAANLDVQNAVREEILKTLEKHNGELNYDTIKDLTFTDMAISETLRKYPVGTVLLRECTQTYQVPNHPLVIEKGTRVLIPVYALHHDPRYFQNPEQFLPNRFSAENKSKIIPGTYLPFGDGPRVCIGLRFALMEMKFAFSKIIPKYEFSLSSRTKYPINFKKGVPLLAPEDGIWLNIKCIN